MNDWTQTDFDAIVVGTGPGGATVARELSKRGKKVLVLERGSGKPIQGTILQFLSFWGDSGKEPVYHPAVPGSLPSNHIRREFDCLICRCF